MLNEVIIGGIYCKKDIGLVLSKAEIGEPELETIAISVPGRDGVLDCTDKMFGRTAYKNRTISLTFQTLDKIAKKSWADLQSDLGKKFHGKVKQIIFSDDPKYYYEGRVSVKTFTAEGKLRTIEMECDCKPYKYLISDPTQKSL